MISESWIAFPNLTEISFRQEYGIQSSFLYNLFISEDIEVW